MNAKTKHYIKLICRDLYKKRLEIRQAQEQHNTKQVILKVREKVELRRDLFEALVVAYPEVTA